MSRQGFVQVWLEMEALAEMLCGEVGLSKFPALVITLTIVLRAAMGPTFPGLQGAGFKGAVLQNVSVKE